MQRSTKSTACPPKRSARRWVIVAALALAAFVTSFTATTAGLPTVALAKEGQGGGQAPPPAGEHAAEAARARRRQLRRRQSRPVCR